jgi:adsorption protein B
LSGIDSVVWLTTATAHELLLFAAVGLLLGGVDDLAIDLIYVIRTIWRRLTVYQRYPATTAATLPPPLCPGRIAIFIGA